MTFLLWLAIRNKMVFYIFKWPICSIVNELIHWGRVTHICFSELPTIGSDNGLSPGRRQAIIWTNAGILLIRTLGVNSSETLSQIHTFSFKKMYLKMPSGKRRPFCLVLNVLSDLTNQAEHYGHEAYNAPLIYSNWQSHFLPHQLPHKG